MGYRNLEYQSRFRADTSELRTAQKELQQTAHATYSLSRSASALAITSSGLRDAMRGNATGLVSVAYGAGLAMRYLANLNPLLRAAGIALAVAAAAQVVFTRRQEEAKTKAEAAARAVDALGLSLSDLQRHQEAGRDAAENFGRIEQAARAAAEAIGRMAAAQDAFNRASSSSAMAQINLDEARALSGAKTPEDKRNIRRQYADKRLEEERRAADREAESKREQINRERMTLVGSEALELERQQHLEERAKVAQGLIDKERDKVAAGIAGRQRTKDEIEADLSIGGQRANPEAVRFAMLEEAKRHQQSESFRNAFDTDPEAALRDFAGQIGEEGVKAFEGLFQNRDAAAKAARDHVFDMQHNEDERRRRREEISKREEAIDPSRQAALDAAKARRINDETALMREENAERERAKAEGKLKQEAIDQAQSSASQAERRYNFDQLGNEKQLEIVEKAIDRTREKIAGSSGEAQAAHRMDLVDQLRERDRISGRIDRDAERDEAHHDRVKGGVSRLQSNIEALMSSRHERDVGLRDVFHHMADVKAGRNPDEIAAQNSILIEQHTKQIAELLKSLKQ